MMSFSIAILARGVSGPTLVSFQLQNKIRRRLLRYLEEQMLTRDQSNGKRSPEALARMPWPLVWLCRWPPRAEADKGSRKERRKTRSIRLMQTGQPDGTAYG